ncbi:hypothetical protein ETB97_007030 [Aspergillus alliaceus]|uniref:FAD dependent oxidoreductase domain-containing protein n=1 Tax=Petromyces alliaceus TaxID=209559 RepID=A0A8H5ZWS2_PETAA|nr:hypothetical protein ETB97_007030 [Aspergillus burnettii]
MPTVILGGGIIGSATAYYLSETHSAEDIHIVETSSELFSSASGYAAGFLASDWFAPSVASLGELSFDLHEALASANGGWEKWGYMKGTALSLNTTIIRRDGSRGDEWMKEGASRAETASGSKLSDPLRLCTFLMETVTSRGVKLHHPAKATSLVTNEAGIITAVKIANLISDIEFMIPCTHLVICAGAWTPQVFGDLFPSAGVSIPISPLAGYSLVLRSPRHTFEHEQKTYGGRSHAIFTSNPFSCGFSPEIFSRRGSEIYVAGLNDPRMPLPSRAEESRNLINQDEMDRYKGVSVQLMGNPADSDTGSTIRNTDDLEVIREGLCFRPVADRGTPIICRVDDKLLGGSVKTGGKGGVFVASGHGPWGISLSLGTGRVVADMVEGVRPSADVYHGV